MRLKAHLKKTKSRSTITPSITSDSHSNNPSTQEMDQNSPALQADLLAAFNDDTEETKDVPLLK